MEQGDTDVFEQIENPVINSCKNCGNTPVVEGYTIPLCAECRKQFANYPVPGWIKMVAVGVLAVMVFALTQFPKSIEAGIAFERGQRAEKTKRFATAAKEYEKVVEVFPGSFIAKGKLFVAYVKNQQIDEAKGIFTQIRGKNSKDSGEVKVIKEANEAIAMLNSYYDVKKELIDIMNQQNTDGLKVSLEKLNEYSQKNPKEFYGFYYLGHTHFDLGNYQEAKSAYLKAVQLKPQIPIGHLGIAAAYRQTGEFDKAIEACNKVLESNVESADAYASLCKVDLKRHKYADALVFAQKAYSYDPENIGVLETLVLAYHFNNLTKERDGIIAVLKDKKDPHLNRIQEIIDGKLKIYE